MTDICERMGIKFQRARRKLGLSIADVAAELCISSRNLKALERGDLDELPGAVYAMGFARSYAEFLGLDADDSLQMAKHCMAMGDPERRPHVPVVERESRFPARLVLVGATSGMLLFFLAWPFVSDAGGLGESLVPEIPKHLAKLLEKEIQNPAPVTKAEPAGTTSHESEPLPSSKEPEAVIEAPAKAPLLNSISASKAQPGAAPVEIRATRDTWVMIKDEKNNTLLNGIIRSGEPFVLKGSARLLLTASDGGSLALYVGGEMVSELGRPGKVIRSVRLDIAGLLEGAS